MFGGCKYGFSIMVRLGLLISIATVAPPQQSPEEIRAMEAEATFTVQQVAATAFMLYLCMYIDPSYPNDDCFYNSSLAPFAFRSN